MDLEELKKAWQSQSARLDRLEEQNLELKRSLRRNKISTNRSKLINTYRVLTVLAFVMTPVITVSFRMIGIDLWLAILYAATMLALGFANMYIYLLIRKISPGELSVREVLKNVLNLERSRHRIRMASMTVTLIVVVLFIYALCDDGDYSMMIGGILGAVIGLIIGLRKEASIKATIRAIKADLKDALRDD